MIVFEETLEDGSLLQRMIPEAAVASWGELLGLTDPGEIIAAIRHVQDHGEPPPDPFTGENVWTEPYRALARREAERQAAEQAAALAAEQDEPELVGRRARRAALTVRSTVDEDVEAARANARAALGLQSIPRVFVPLAVDTGAHVELRESFLKSLAPPV